MGTSTVKGKRYLLLSIFLAMVIGFTFYAAGCGEKAETPGSTYALSSRVEYVETNYPNNDAGDYTEDSYSALMQVLAEAKQIIAEQKSSQSVINDCKDRLNAAIKNLTLTYSANYSLEAIAAYFEDTFKSGIDEPEENHINSYTLNITDYYLDGATKDSPKNYKTYVDDYSMYNEKYNVGITAYDGYMHSYTLNDSGEVVIGKVYFDEDTPPRYLYDDELDRVVFRFSDFPGYEIGNIANYKLIKNTDMYYSVNKNYTKYFFTMMHLDYNNYDEDFKDILYGTSIQINDEVDTLTFGFHGEGGASDMLFSYSVTDIGKTSVPKISEYKEANPEYTSTVNPSKNSAVSSLNTQYMIMGSYGVSFDVRNTYLDTGRNDMHPEYCDYSVAAVLKGYKADGSYWYSGRSNIGVYTALGSLMDITLTEESAAIGDYSKYTFDDYDIVDLLTYGISKFSLREGTDEWYLTSGTADFDAAAELFVRFFDIKDYDAEKNPLTAISVTEEDGSLVVSAWKQTEDWTGRTREGLAIRAVLSSYANVSNTLIENCVSDVSNAGLLLERSVANAEAKYSQADYTASTFSVYKQAVSSAKAAYGKEGVTIEELTQASTDLSSSIKGLKFAAADKEVKNLQNLIVKAKLYDSNKYLTASYTLLSGAVTEAENYLSSTAADERGKEAISELTDTLTAKIKGLTKAGNKTELSTLVSSAEEKELSLYTAVSSDTLTAAITAAKSISEKSDASEQEVSAAVSSLKSALDGLKIKAESGELTELKGVLAEANAITKTVPGEDNKEYTQQSYDALDKVRIYVNSVIDGELSGEECTEYKDVLNARMAELELTSYAPVAGNQAVVDFLDKVKSEDGIKNYTISIIYNGETRKYHYSNSYFYDEYNASGYVLVNGIVYVMAVESGKVVLGDMLLNSKGLPVSDINKAAVNLSQGGWIIQDYASYSGIYRISNSSEYFSGNTNYTENVPYSFIPEYLSRESEITGFSVKIEKINGAGTAVFTLWTGGSNIKLQSSVSKYLAAYTLRNKILCTATLTDIGGNGVGIIEDFLNQAQPPITKQSVIDKINSLGDNYTLISGNDMVKITSDTIFNGEEGYVLNDDGTAYKVYDIDGETKTAGDKINADKISDLSETLVSACSSLSEADLTETDGSYIVSGDISSKIISLFGIEYTYDMQLIVSLDANGNLYFVLREPDYWGDMEDSKLIAVSAVGTTAGIVIG